MYLSQSILQGLKILTLDKKTIKSTAREKNLEEIFLSTLFLNYLIVVIIYIISMINGGFSINERALNPTVFYAIIMIYPFFFNLMIYLIYGLFGIVAEHVEKKAHVKPLLCVGFHSAIVYAILFYAIFLAMTFDLAYGLFLLGGFALYFIYAMISILKIVYNFSGNKIAIVVFLPFVVISLLIAVTLTIFPNLASYLFI